MGCVHARKQSTVIAGKENMTQTRPKRFERLDCRMRSLQTSDKILENVTIVSHSLDEFGEVLAKRTIDDHSLFSELEPEQKQKLVSELIEVQGKKGQYVFKQGDRGSCFFIVRDGQVAVQVNGKQVKIMNQGQMFGEMALVYCAERSASVKCLSQKATFLAMKSYIFKKTMKQISLRNAEKMHNIINRVKIFSFLTNKQKHIISNNLVRQVFIKDQCIFKVNEPANSFYIIEKGSVKIEIPSKEDIIIKEEDSFGENSFYQNGQRSGSAFANEDRTILISIGRQEIEKCLGESVSGLIHHNVKKWALTRSDMFQKYNQKQINLIAEAFQMKYSKGQNQVLMPAGKHPNSFLICMEGQINGQPPGTLFGDNFYGKKENILSTAIIKNNKGSYATLEFKALSRINQSLRNEKNGVVRKSTENNVKVIENKTQKAISNQKAKSQFQGLEMLQKLGEGQFGEVYLVRNPNHGNALYAIKCISIEEIRKEGIEDCLVSERKILSKVTFPAIVGFVEAYRDKQYVYFLMQFISGVEMFDILREIGLVNRNISTYYSATLILAVEYLHNLGVVYRDLKPQNSVVGDDGRVYLIDMGTAKYLNEKNSFRTFTIIGTPHYMAPEVFQGKGYSYEADYWSLGVMLFQFICGNLPYGNNATDPYGIFAEIMSHPLKFPAFVNDSDAEAVIRRLLCKNYNERSSENGFEGIKKMSYFANVDWGSLLTKMAPPYIPKKFRNISSNAYYKNLKGEPFLAEFYRAQNTKSLTLRKKPLSSQNAEIQIWDDDNL